MKINKWFKPTKKKIIIVVIVLFMFWIFSSVLLVDYNSFLLHKIEDKKPESCPIRHANREYQYNCGWIVKYPFLCKLERFSGFNYPEKISACFIDSAIENKDLSLCQQAKKWKDICEDKVKIIQNNPMICSNLTLKEMEECWWRLRGEEGLNYYYENIKH